MKTLLPFILVGALMATLVPACGEPDPSDRFLAQRSLGSATVARAALRIRVSPGANPIFDASPSTCSFDVEDQVPADFRIAFRASAPTPQFTFSHGNEVGLGLEFAVANVLQGARFVPSIQPVDPALFPGCAETGGTNAFLADLNIARLGNNVARACVVIPRCSRVDIKVLPEFGLAEADVANTPEGECPDPSATGVNYLLGSQNSFNLCPETAEQVGCNSNQIPFLDEACGCGCIRRGDPLRIAVVGEVQGNEAVFSRMVTSAQEWPADFIVALGDLANSEELADLQAFRELADGADIPTVAILGRAEATGGSLLPFHRVFGRSDFTARIGDVLIAVLDTASSELSDAQYNFWQNALAEVPKESDEVRVAFMHVPPFDPSGTRDDGFNSRFEAARLITLLGEGAVDAVFTGGIGTYSSDPYGGIAIYSTGGGGGPIESGSTQEHHYLRVTITPGADAPVSVEVVDL
ncbi:MAG: metallophosphoesterase [Myxococcales bacterium]|nr:metallophosphoesterase [Myxococcales bacterium]